MVFPVTGKIRQRTISGSRLACDLDLFPGDTVTIIRPKEDEITEGIVCVLHTSPVSILPGEVPEKIVCLCIESGTDRNFRKSRSAQSSEIISSIVSSVVLGLPRLVSIHPYGLK